MKHKQQCDQEEVTSIKTSNESHLYFEKYFQNNPVIFMIYAYLVADNEKDISNRGDKATNINMQNPVCNCYYIVSELNDILKS